MKVRRITGTIHWKGFIVFHLAGINHNKLYLSTVRIIEIGLS
jgi:hypothetical protein